MPMRCDLITLFPEMVLPVLGQSILKRAREKGLLEVRVRNLRDYTLDRHQAADDAPYGGRAGMVLKGEAILRAVDALGRGYDEAGKGSSLPILLSSAEGWPLTQHL